jgi:hypothetical protein
MPTFCWKRLGWKRLDVQRQIQEATMVYESLNGLTPDYLYFLINVFALRG